MMGIKNCYVVIIYYFIIKTVSIGIREFSSVGEIIHDKIIMKNIFLEISNIATTI